MKIEHIALYVNDLELQRTSLCAILTPCRMRATTTRGRTSAPTSHFRGRRTPGADEQTRDVRRAEACRPHRIRAHRVQRRSRGEGGCADGPASRPTASKSSAAPRTTGDGYYESCVLAVEGNQVEITV